MSRKTPAFSSSALLATENEDSAMSAYERAMAFYNQGGQMPQDGTPGEVTNFQEPSFPEPELERRGDGYPQQSQPSDGFVQANFNDPWYRAEQIDTLERVNNSWGDPISVNNPMDEPYPPVNNPLPSEESPNMPSTQAFSSGEDIAGGDVSQAFTLPSYQQSFIDALSPNSEKRNSGLAMPEDTTFPAIQQPADDNTPPQPSQTDTWEPLLTFSVKEDAPIGQGQQSTPLQQDPIENNQVENWQQSSQTSNFNTQAKIPQRQYVSEPPANPIPNPLDTTESPAEAQIQSQKEDETDEPTFGIESIQPPSALNDFMNTAWEDQKKKHPKDPMKAVSDLTKGVLGTKPERKDTAPPFVVQPGATKRILESLDQKDRYG